MGIYLYLPMLPYIAQVSTKDCKRVVSKDFKVRLYVYLSIYEKDSRAVSVWLPAPLPTSRAPPDWGALWPLA